MHDVNSSAFQYVVNHQKEIADKFPRQGASLDRRLLEDWIAGSYAYLTVDESGHCTFDEQGLDAYVAKMKQMNVAEADMIGESLRLSRDGIMKQWDSFVKRGDKILASHTILGDEGHLLQWVNWLNKECADMSLRGCGQSVTLFSSISRRWRVLLSCATANLPSSVAIYLPGKEP